ncbi:hypothetical protein [Actinomadura miaoliensis]|uniref:AraC family transcriptional regulator n=1 Tax=Actinomadura miaoliensis TaxID=430685 RepID=A0ABP7VNN1_9ACTN
MAASTLPADPGDALAAWENALALPAVLGRRPRCAIPLRRLLGTGFLGRQVPVRRVMAPSRHARTEQFGLRAVEDHHRPVALSVVLHGNG